jgi:hypothetical protein
MTIRKSVALVLLAGLIGCSGGEEQEKPKKEDAKGDGVVVTFDTLKSTAPASWKKEEPKPSPFPRAYQFKLPGTEEGKNDAEIVVFSGIGGSAKANLDRWKGQFTPPEGKKLDDVAKVEEIKVAGCPVSILDVRGSYAGMGGGRNPNWRLVGVHFEAPDKVYHIMMRGPEATVEKHKKAFDEWLRGFKK